MDSTSSGEGEGVTEILLPGASGNDKRLEHNLRGSLLKKYRELIFVL